MVLRDLTRLDEFRRVVELEKCIWGYGDGDDLVGVPILAISVKRGGILIGAFDAGDEMVGFVYSLAAMREGRPTQWSHMLGVVPAHRNGGVGCRLKVAQRERTLRMGLDLVEWTFDPLQAPNAHLNFNKLGIVASAYAVDIYGTSSSPLHQGSPTDRLVAEWWVRSRQVERRLAGQRVEPLPAGAENAVPANTLSRRGEHWECRAIDPAADGDVVTIEIPIGFGEMPARDPRLALEWRLATRELFTACFARGMQAVAFRLDRARGTGRYYLVRAGSADTCATSATA